MDTWASAFQARLTVGETLLTIVENLGFNLLFVPHVAPTGNYQASLLRGALALTNRRLIAAWAEGEGWKWFYIPALNSLSERPLRRDKPGWPHQVILMVPGGIGLVVQTATPSVEHARQLSSLVAQALVLLGPRQVNDDALAAIIDYEEEQERRRQQDWDEQRRRKEKTS